MSKRAVVLISCILATGCYSAPPKFWEAACRDEAVIQRHETPAPAGLAVPGRIWVAFKVLAFSGAAWVEHDVHSARGGIYTDGPGRYRIWLANIAEPACRQALRDDGIDPDTRTPVQPNPKAPIFAAQNACLKAERLGDVAQPGFEGRGELSLEEQFEGWSAPYLLTTTGGRDPRSEPDDPVWRSAIQVVSRETHRPIFEAPSFSYTPKTNWFPAMNTCGAEPLGFVGLTERSLRGVFAPGN